MLCHARLIRLSRVGLHDHASISSKIARGSLRNAVVITEYLTLETQKYFIPPEFKALAGVFIMKKEKKKLIHKLKNRYRLVIINDTTYEEKFSFSLTPMNLFVGFSSFLVFFATILTLAIVFTPMREYIPGYADPDMKKNVARLIFRSDSLEQVLRNKEGYFRNIMNILEDRIENPDTTMLKIEKRSSALDPTKKYELEEELKAEFEGNGADNYSLSNEGGRVPSSIENIGFMNPVSGLVTNMFDYGSDHFAVDIVTRPDESVKAALDGRVILSSWTPETGNVMAIQHRNNVVTIYKHNAVLLKKVGTFVSAGDAIAIVGNSGELSTGPHLHFEIWANGNAVNPEQFINF
jgi:murein DD-endopeptidase MepM/ murein hydrolase activator NlpD